MLIALLALNAALAEGCPPAPDDAFAAALVAGGDAVHAGSWAALDADLAAAMAALGCLEQPVDRGDAAALQRLLAAQALSADRAGEALAHLKAAGALAPEGALEAPLEETGGWWLVDGARSRAAPLDRPYLLQRVEGGAVVESRLVSPELRGAAPGEPAGVVRTPAPTPRPAPVLTDPRQLPALSPPPERDTRRWLLVGAGGAALVSGGMYLAAAGKAATFEDLGTPEAELEGLRRQTNALVVGSAVLGIGALGAAGAAVVIDW
jgi:hypothetical protein